MNQGKPPRVKGASVTHIRCKIAVGRLHRCEKSLYSEWSLSPYPCNIHMLGIPIAITLGCRPILSTLWPPRSRRAIGRQTNSACPITHFKSGVDTREYQPVFRLGPSTRRAVRPAKYMSGSARVDLYRERRLIVLLAPWFHKCNNQVS